jgi:4'-phosphopantetheinyl transferase
VHVYWYEQCAADVPASDDWLSDSEKARAAAFHILKRRADWRLGRWTAKCAVAAYLRRSTAIHDLAQIEIKLAPSGAPVAFLGDTRAPCFLSFSHRASRALCTVGPPSGQLGCDLELIEPRIDAFIGDYFTDHEQATIARTPLAQRDTVVTLLWSLKESALKALEVGLRVDTRSVDVTLPLAASTTIDDPTRWQESAVQCSTGMAFFGYWHHRGDHVYTLACSHSCRVVALQSQSGCAASAPLFPEMPSPIYAARRNQTSSR